MIKLMKLRWDFLLCFLLAMCILFGLYKVGEGLNLTEIVDQQLFHWIDRQYEVNEVAAGEVGGIADVTIPRVYNIEELETQGYFTMEVSEFSFIGTGEVYGGGYSWKIIKLDNQERILALINKESIQEIEEGKKTTLILPVGTIKKEPVNVDALAMIEAMKYSVPTDFYIDMDGGATPPTNDTMLLLIGVGSILINIIYFVFFLGVIMGLHYIGVKMKWFPPVFSKGR